MSQPQEGYIVQPVAYAVAQPQPQYIDGKLQYVDGNPLYSVPQPQPVYAQGDYFIGTNPHTFLLTR